jgi:tryptophanyl-tRNA synthetase
VGCTTAAIGCFDCKKWLHEAMMIELAPIQEREQQLKKRPDDVKDVLESGAKKCRAIAAQTMEEVNQKLGIPSHKFSA